MAYGYCSSQSNGCLSIDEIEPSITSFGYTDSAILSLVSDKQEVNNTKRPDERSSKIKKGIKKKVFEPNRPVSAYALFFRDTQAQVKQNAPNISFGDISKTVASAWDSLDHETKSKYRQKAENARREYLKRLAVYRAKQVAQGDFSSGTNASFRASSVNGTNETTKQNSYDTESMDLTSLLSQPIC